ncbi:hypothetical protein J4449_04535 [Candidatus Woesearchaeota archaeon]|nr:hypothetical protein [Candidatus Woesearchaeota archaeon]
MEKNNRVLVAVILLIFVTLLSFNIDSISGYQTKQLNKPSVTVTPKVVEPGQRITVEVISSKLGVNEKACLYDHNSRVACTNTVCNQEPERNNRHYKCVSDSQNPINFNFALSTSLPSGIYNVCTWDYEVAQENQGKGDYSQSRGYVCGDFTIREPPQPEREKIGESS